MRKKRSYDDGCASVHAMELIGERWALLVVRELMLGPRRFTDIRIGLPGISPNVLTQRLEELEAAALVRRRKLPPPASLAVYELTPWGLEFEPIMQALGRWAVRSPTKKMGPLGVNSLVLSFRTMFDGSRAGDFRAVIGFEINGQWFEARVANGALDIRPEEMGPAEAGRSGAACDAALRGDSNAIAGFVYGGQPLPRMIKAGALAAEGDLAVLERFATLFPLPESEPAASPAPTPKPRK